MNLNQFLNLYIRVPIVCFAIFCISFLSLLCGILYDLYVLRKAIRQGLRASTTPMTGAFGKLVRAAVKTAGLSSLQLLIVLSTNAVRRGLTDASSFSQLQMGYHTLNSLVDILITALFYRFVCRRPWPNLHLNKGLFSMSKKAWKPSGGAWLQRMVTMLGIAVATHTITPVVFALMGCVSSYDWVDYSESPLYKSKGLWGVVLFFMVQQVCFFFNAVDEETAWRGVISSLWQDPSGAGKGGRRARFTMYLTSGLVYAGCHTLNIESTFKEFLQGPYFIMVMNVTVEGACWMYLLQTTQDLVGNWLLHDFDDLMSIWFGPASLAGYVLPAGSIATYKLGRCSGFWSGGDFGVQATFVYVVQNVYTYLFVLFLKRMLREKDGFNYSQVSGMAESFDQNTSLV